MSPLFRRRADEDAEPTEVDDVAQGSPAAADVLPAEPGPTTGPWDEADVPADDVPRVDLGAMLVPVTEQLELRVELAPDHTVVGATLVDGQSTMQVNVFAAPRTEGIWDEIRYEIAEALRGGGGTAEDGSGRFGAELVARIPTEVPGQQQPVLQSARFLGVDGPRWFLRALLTGPAATDRGAATRLEAAFADVVVVRGTEAMAARDPLPLRLPKEAADAAQQHEQEQAARPDLAPFERGPEITETR